MDYSPKTTFGYEVARIGDRVREFRGDWNAYARKDTLGLVLTHMTGDEVDELRRRFELEAETWRKDMEKK